MRSWFGVIDAIAKRLDARVQATLKAVRDDLRSIAGRQKRVEEIARSLAAEQVALRLLLQRRPRAGSPSEPDGEAAGAQPLAGPQIPLSLDQAPAPRAFTSDRSLTLTRTEGCPACGGTERTLVCEYNKSVVIGIEIEEPMRRYDYVMCHGCGLTYASLRPTGDAYAYLFSRFDESLGRELPKGGKRNPLLSPLPLSDAERATLKQRVERGALVSEHLELGRNEVVPQLLSDRLANSAHLEILGSLLTLKKPRVLEIRLRFGAIGAGLRRLYDADVRALPMTEAQAFVIREAYGIEASGLIDFDHFSIPYEGPFDLIVAAHMFTHVLRPAEFFAELKRHLVPGGHIYLHKEPDDTDFLDGPMAMFNSMNPFHMQVFDRKALVRALGVFGFEPVFVGHHQGSLVFLGRATDRPVAPAFAAKERGSRVAAYLRARDASILRLPERERWRFGAEWPEVVERAVAGGVAEFDEQGRLRIVRKRGATVAAED